MSLRGNSVVVDPSAWTGELEDLARRLVPIVGQPSKVLVERLSKGPMTLESDLTAASAQTLCDRLERVGVVAEVLTDLENVDFDIDVDVDLDALFSEVENLPGDTSAIFDASAETDPRKTQMGFATAIADTFQPPKKEASGWGGVFPEMDEPKTENKPKPRPVSPFRELEETVITPPTTVANFADADKAPISLLDQLIQNLPEEHELEKETEPSKISPVLKKAPEKFPPIRQVSPPPLKPAPQKVSGPTPPSLDELAGLEPPKVERIPLSHEDAWDTIDIPRGPEPINVVNPIPKPAKTPAQPQMTAAAFIEQIVGKQDEVGPYAPTGYDDGYEHAPSVARILSIIAPGAGQVYNGSDEKAVTYAAKSIFIKPYFDALKDATEHAEKIRTYHRPKPEKGSFQRAMMHVAGFWLVIVFSTTSAYFVLTRYVFHESKAEELRTIRPVDIMNAYNNARAKTLEGRLRGIERVRQELQKEVAPVFTMSESERVRRLYSVGVERCRKKEYGSCSAIMGKVVKLDPLYRSALTLQTWGSAQMTSKIKKPIPDVGDVPTLTELEKSELNDQVEVP